MTTKTEIALGEIKSQLQNVDDRGQYTKDKVDELYNVVVVGNGHPSLRSQVARHNDWINNANRLIWIVITALIGQLIVTACAASVWIFTFLFYLARIGLIKP